MNGKSALDEIDRKILHELTGDAEKPYSQIAKSLDVSNTMIHQRIARMKQLGVIEHTEIKLNEKILGFGSSAFTGIILKEVANTARVIDALQKVPEVVECYFVSGAYNLFVKIIAQNNDHLMHVLYDKIDSIKGIVRTETLINFRTVIKRGCPIPEE
jgi:Lrp/AsnC family transcriptional regulator for asnA, asnC and gidA